MVGAARRRRAADRRRARIARGGAARAAHLPRLPCDPAPSRGQAAVARGHRRAAAAVAGAVERARHHRAAPVPAPPVPDLEPASPSRAAAHRGEHRSGCSAQPRARTVAPGRSPRGAGVRLSGAGARHRPPVAAVPDDARGARRAGGERARHRVREPSTGLDRPARRSALRRGVRVHRGARAARASGGHHRRLDAYGMSSDADDLPRLSKRMGELGLCSRREAEQWITAGWVKVDGRVVDVLGTRVSRKARIEVDPRARAQQAELVTVILNKPIGYVSGQAEDGYEPATVLIRPENRWPGDDSGRRFEPRHLEGLAPAGRLDIDSTGLMVYTQDGRVAKHLIGGNDVEKEYLVR
ncbi:MAG: rRNA pseudouridine synthase, partial [Gammaproteobacteria bacterium]|nr:rRNA pseudouridine synthase [Gammaproteobacteria bacterium]